jgi:hypothetical protein
MVCKNLYDVSLKGDPENGTVLISFKYGNVDKRTYDDITSENGHRFTLDPDGTLTETMLSISSRTLSLYLQWESYLVCNGQNIPLFVVTVLFLTAASCNRRNN